MIKVKKLIISGLLLVSCGYVYAKGVVDSGLVVNGQLGYGQMNLSYDSKTFPVKFKKGNLAYGGGLGLQFGLVPKRLAVGVEADILYGRSIATVTTNGKETKVSNLLVPVMGTLIYDFSSLKLNVFAKGGIAYNKPSVSKTGNQLKVEWNSSWEPAAAIGVGFNPFGGLNIFVQYLHIFGNKKLSDNSSIKPANIDTVTAGVSYNF